ADGDGDHVRPGELNCVEHDRRSGALRSVRAPELVTELLTELSTEGDRSAAAGGFDARLAGAGGGADAPLFRDAVDMDALHFDASRSGGQIQVEVARRTI